MFDKNYKNAMDNITTDGETREKILDKIMLKEELKQRKNPALPWRIAFACVACVAVILGVVFVPKSNFKNIVKNDTVTPGALKISKSYDEIYKLIKPKKDYTLFGGFGVTKDDAEIVYEEEYAYDTDANSNGTAMPGATNGSNTGANNSSANQSTNADNATNSGANKGEDFSGTTEQVEGVAEADIVKTDGKYIYYLIGNELTIYKAVGEESTLVSRTDLNRQEHLSGDTSSFTDDNGYGYGDMFLKDDRLIILRPNDYINDATYVTIIIYDVSNPTQPTRVARACQEGIYNSARMVGDYMYLISNCYINTGKIDKDDPATFVPTTETNGVYEPVPADKIYHYEEDEYQSRYTVIGAFNYKDGTMSDTASLLGGTNNIYCSQGNIILATAKYNNVDSVETEEYSTLNTVVSRLAINDGAIEYKATGEIEGTLNNQFFIDEHNGYFRFVTTVNKAIQKTYKFDNTESSVVSYEQETYAKLTILDADLKDVGKIENLARGERVYSVRFMGNTAYFVTFRQTDPLFSADLSDPTNPKILGELKIPGFSEYMYPYGEGKLLGFGMDADTFTGRTTYLKLSMFDINDPANVTEQDKTIIQGYNYSTALDNHKAMLVSPSKNLIGFVAHDIHGMQKYKIYVYADGRFYQKAEITPPYENGDDYWKYWDATRGLFIGENFYLVSDKGLQVFDIETFTQLALIKR